MPRALLSFVVTGCSGVRTWLANAFPCSQRQALTSVLKTACHKRRIVCQQKQQACFRYTHCKSNDEMQPTPECGLRSLLEKSLLLKCTTLLQCIATLTPFAVCKNMISILFSTSSMSTTATCPCQRSWSSSSSRSHRTCFEHCLIWSGRHFSRQCSF